MNDDIEEKSVDRSGEFFSLGLGNDGTSLAGQPFLQLSSKNQIRESEQYDETQKELSERFGIKDIALSGNFDKIDDIEERIDEYLCYTIVTWILWLVHLFNLGYFLFYVLVDYSNEDFQGSVFGSIVWNSVHMIIWWEAFKAKDDLSIIRQKFCLGGLLFTFGVIAIGLILLAFGVTFLTDIIYTASTGIVYQPLKADNLMGVIYLIAVILEILLPACQFYQALQIKKLLEQRSQVTQNQSTQRQ